MRGNIVILLLLSFLSSNACAFAFDKVAEEVTQNKSEVTIYDDAPVWEEYVAPKYRNPRTDFDRGASITELSIGILLTELILTSPIGIPMTIHGSTKVKMVSYANRKRIFDEEIARARTIDDPVVRNSEYQRILHTCNLKESTRKHYAKKYAKAQAKLARKQAKELKKQSKKSK